MLLYDLLEVLDLVVVVLLREEHLRLLAVHVVPEDSALLEPLVVFRLVVPVV